MKISTLQILSLKVYIGRIFTSKVYIDVLFDIYHIITFQFNVDSYKYLSHIVKLIILIVTCIYKKLIENTNIPNIEFTGVYWQYFIFQSVY